METRTNPANRPITAHDCRHRSQCLSAHLKVERVGGYDHDKRPGPVMDCRGCDRYEYQRLSVVTTTEDEDDRVRFETLKLQALAATILERVPGPAPYKVPEE